MPSLPSYPVLQRELCFATATPSIHVQRMHCMQWLPCWRANFLGHSALTSTSGGMDAATSSNAFFCSMFVASISA